MIELPDLAAGGLAAGTLSALALGGGLLRSRRQKAALRAELTETRARLESAQQAFTAEIEHLAARRIPAAAQQLAHPHVVVPGPQQPQTAGTPAGIALEHALTALRAELTAQRTRIDAAPPAGQGGAPPVITGPRERHPDPRRRRQNPQGSPGLSPNPL
ncbi:protein kinase, partial [Streptomyces sp. NPDC058964]